MPYVVRRKMDNLYLTSKDEFDTLEKAYIFSKEMWLENKFGVKEDEELVEVGIKTIAIVDPKKGFIRIG